jgi:hypothetical protein
MSTVALLLLLACAELEGRLIQGAEVCARCLLHAPGSTVALDVPPLPPVPGTDIVWFDDGWAALDVVRTEAGPALCLQYTKSDVGHETKTIRSDFVMEPSDRFGLFPAIPGLSPTEWKAFAVVLRLRPQGRLEQELTLHVLAASSSDFREIGSRQSSLPAIRSAWLTDVGFAHAVQRAGGTDIVLRGAALTANSPTSPIHWRASIRLGEETPHDVGVSPSAHEIIADEPLCVAGSRLLMTTGEYSYSRLTCALVGGRCSTSTHLDGVAVDGPDHMLVRRIVAARANYPGRAWTLQFSAARHPSTLCGSGAPHSVMLMTDREGDVLGLIRGRTIGPMNVAWTVLSDGAVVGVVAEPWQSGGITIWAVGPWGVAEVEVPPLGGLLDSGLGTGVLCKELADSQLLVILGGLNVGGLGDYRFARLILDLSTSKEPGPPSLASAALVDVR